MQNHRQLFCSLLLFFLLLLATPRVFSKTQSKTSSVTQAKNQSPVKSTIKIVNNHAIPFYIKKDEVEHFTFQPQNQKEIVQFRIHLSPLRHDSHFDVTLMKLNVRGILKNKPGEELALSPTCVGTLTLDCTMNVTKNAGLSSLLLDLNCLNEASCKGHISISGIKEFTLESGVPEVFHFFNKETEKFVFEVPNKAEVDHIVIAVDFHNKHAGSGNEYHLAGYQLSKGHPYMMRSKHRLILVLSANDRDLCFECQNYLDISSHVNSLVTIEVKIFGPKNNFLRKEIRQTDMLLNGTSNLTYKVEIPNLDVSRNVILRLKTITGKSKLIFAHINSPPQKFNDYTYKNQLIHKDSARYHEFTEEDLFIPGKEASGKTLYVAVVGEPGLFDIEVITRNDYLRSLSLGENERGSIYNGELLIYQISVWKNDSAKNVDRNVSIDLTFSSGAGSLYITQCAESCEVFKQSEIEKRKFLLTRKSLKNDQIHLSPDCDDTKSKPFCLYSIAILGQSLDSEVSTFHLLVRQESSRVDLIRNQPIHGVLKPESLHHYHFSLGSLDSLQDVIFRVSASHLDLYVSTSCANPEQDCKDAKIGNLESPVTYLSDKLNPDQQFYLSVIAKSKIVKYFIVVEVNRKGETNIHNIWEGMPFSYEIDAGKELALFRFHVNLKEKKNIELHLNGPKGQLLMVASGSELHKIEESQNSDSALSKQVGTWRTTGTDLWIDHHSKGYKRKGTYYVLVARSDMNTDSSNAVSFNIMYATENTIRHMPSNNHIFGKLTQEHNTKRYFFYVHPKDSVQISVYLVQSVNTPANSLEVVVSDSPRSEEKTANNFKLSPASFHNDKEYFIDLDKGKVKHLCKTHHNHCPLYLEIHSTVSQELLYGASVNHGHHATKLIEGHLHKIPIIINNGTFAKKLYFKPITLKHSYNIYFRMDNNSEFIVDSHSFNSQKLRNITEEFFVTRQFRGSGTLEVSANVLNHTCDKDCLIIMMVEVNDTNVRNGTKIDALSIMLGGHYVELNHGEHFKFHLNKNQHKLFSFDLTHIIKLKSVVVISLTSLSGSAQLFVEERSNALGPEDESRVVFSKYATNNQLIVSSDELKIPADENPSLIIDVGSPAGGVFIIETFSGDIQKLIANQPRETLIPAGKRVIFELESRKYDNLTVTYALNSGQGVLSLYMCSWMTLYDNCIRTTPVKKEEIGQNQNELAISEVCQSCYYLIELRSLKTTELRGRLTAFVNEPFRVILAGVSHSDNVSPGQDKIFRWEFSPTKEIQITLNSLTPGAQLEIFIGLDAYDGDEPHYFAIEKPSTSSQTLVFTVDATAINQALLRSEVVHQVKKNEKVAHQTLFLFVRVTCKDTGNVVLTAADFQITATGENVIRVIRHGILERLKLTASFATKLSFHSYLPDFKGDEKIKPLSLYLRVSEKNISDITFKLKFKPMTIDLSVPTDEDPNKLETVNQESRFTSKDTLQIDVPPKNGTFFLELTNKKKDDIFVDIFIAGREFTHLTANTPIHKSLTPGESNFYQITAPSKGQIAIQVFSCLGRLELLLSESYKDFKNGVHKQMVLARPDENNINTINIDKPGLIFLGIRNKGSNLAFYNLNYHWSFSHGTSVYSLVAPGNQGRVQFLDDRKEGNLKLKFAPVTCRSCSKNVTLNADVEYEVIISSTYESVTLEGKCGITEQILGRKQVLNSSMTKVIHKTTIGTYQLGGKPNSKAKKTNTINITEGLIDYETDVHYLYKEYFVTIKATVKGLNSKSIKAEQTFDIFYDTFRVGESSEIDPPIFEVSDGAKKVLAILILSVASIILIFVAWCWNKRRIRNIQYEMTDIKKVATFGANNTDVSSNDLGVEENKENVRKKYDNYGSD